MSPAFRSFPVVILSLLLVTACRNQPEAESNAANENGAGNLVPAVAPPSNALDRAAFLEAIDAAASAYAAGIDDSEAQRALAGRLFELRMPFGCEARAGSRAGDSSLSLEVRPDGASYEARAKPTLDAGAADIVTVAGDGKAAAAGAIQSVEGFWIQRPWLRVAQCPKTSESTGFADPAMTLRPDEPAPGTASPRAAPALPPPPPTVGIAQFFTANDSRLTSRSGRDFSRVVTLDAGSEPPNGLNLVLQGRLRAWPDGRVIRCIGDNPDKRPTCVAGATTDRVAFERIDDGTIVAEWGN